MDYVELLFLFHMGIKIKIKNRGGELYKKMKKYHRYFKTYIIFGLYLNNVNKKVLNLSIARSVFKLFKSCRYYCNRSHQPDIIRTLDYQLMN